MSKIAAMLLCFILGMSNLCHADMYHDYVEYRYQPDLGKITILSSSVRNVKYVDYVSDNWEELAKENIFIHGPRFQRVARTFKRSDTIGEYQIDTALTLYPPVGHGMGGALPITYLKVSVNGKLKIDCNIGYFPGGNEEVSQIMICPEDNAIFVSAFGRVHTKRLCEIFIYMDGPEIITNEYIKEDKH